MAITYGIATVAVGAYSAYQTGKTAKAARSQAGEVNARQRYYNDLLMQLMENPDKILSDPGYQLSFDQGIQAVERSSAAKGFTGSGNAAIALQTFGQSFSSQYLRDQQKLLASLSGANVGNSPAQGYSVAGQGFNDSFNQFGSVLASLGYTFGNSGGAGGSGGFGSGSGTIQDDPGLGDAGGGYIFNTGT